MELIFIYNAQKGRLNSLIDYIHKTVSPGTYSCNLCAITHNFKKKIKWDNFIKRPDVVLIDTRNFYETEIGSFAEAINPKARNFTELLNWLKKNMLTDENKKKKIKDAVDAPMPKYIFSSNKKFFEKLPRKKTVSE